MLPHILRPWQTAELAYQGHFSIELPAFPSPVNYQVKLSKKRRTLSLEITNQHILIRAPEHTPKYLIEQFLLERQYWLQEKLTKQSALPQNQMGFQCGDSFYYLGEKYQLVLKLSDKYTYQLNEHDKTLTMFIPLRVKNIDKYVEKQLKAFIVTQAERQIRFRFSELENQLCLFSSALEFKFYKRRWGCCYQTGLIRINPLLISAPQWVVDCVLIHELCHLKHLNHSADFWQLNQQYCGNCQATKEWLQQHHLALQIF